jgi:non-ribosomal peptide synthetase component E (peptide arylation enzyme)
LTNISTTLRRPPPPYAADGSGPATSAIPTGRGTCSSSTVRRTSSGAAGENVSSLEVEAALIQHAGVAEVAFVPQPDRVLGEPAAAFVAPAGAELPSLGELREFCATQLAPQKLPEHVEAIAELPRTGNGTVEKFRLREALVARPE